MNATDREINPDAVREKFLAWKDDVFFNRSEEIATVPVVVFFFSDLVFAAFAFYHVWTAAVFVVFFALWLLYIITCKLDTRLNRDNNAIEKGCVVCGRVVWADDRLFRAGKEPGGHAFLVYSLDTLPDNAPILEDIATRMAALANTVPDNPMLQEIALRVSDGRHCIGRRLPLPLAFTGGAEVYFAEMRVFRSSLKGGYLTDRTLWCFVPGGSAGFVEVVPWNLLD